MDIGSKLKRLRLMHGLTQHELAIRCDLTKGFISQIERNLTSPSIATLNDILEVLGTDIRRFFNEKEADKIVFQKADIVSSTNEELKNTIEFLVPNAQSNSMEPILITLDAGGKSQVLTPNESEEYGYVLSGSILVCIDDKMHKVNKGESFYLKSDCDHFLKNENKRRALVLWISSPPSF